MESIIAGKYKINAELGRGSMGMVYKVRHDSLGREDALKVLHPTLSGDKEFLRRFEREAQAMASLDHINIVRVYDSFEFEQKYYIAMEYFDAYSVASILQNNKKLSVLQVLSIISQATSGLAYAHARGIIHCDIKPENMLVNSTFRVKLTDFGIAKAKSDFVEIDDSEVCGSPRYMSPEQACGGDVDKRSDLYSLGMVFYELISRNELFKGETGSSIISKLVNENEVFTLEFPPNIPNKVQRIIRTLLQRDPDKRYADASALQIEIAETMGREKSLLPTTHPSSESVYDSMTSVSFPIPPLSRNSRSLTWILLLTLFLVSGAYVYVSHKTIIPQLVSLMDFRPATAIAEENAKLEVDRMLIHLRDHETAANDARKKIIESSLTTEAKKLYDEAVIIQINGTTELTEAKAHIARSEYEEALVILLTAETFFEESEKQFLLAKEATEIASSSIVVEGLIEEASLLKQEVFIDKQNAIDAKANSRKVAEFIRGVFYHNKAERMFANSRKLLKEKNRLKSRVSIDDAIPLIFPPENTIKKLCAFPKI